MTRLKLVSLLAIVLCGVALAQNPILVSSEVATSHLTKRFEPVYPGPAQEARIQGNVILRIKIDSNGKVSQVNVMRGHPMLTSAAVACVWNWKYQPFLSNGQPVAVSTLVLVRFGNPTNHDAEDNGNIAFFDTYTPAAIQARAALRTSKFVEAQQALDEAKKALAAVGDPANHRFELWEWAMLTGELNQKQNRLPEAEQRYKEALAIEKDRKDSAQAADSLNALGTLYFDMKETDLSRENLTKAIAMYRKDYKSASKNPDLQDAYGRAIANDSWLLSKIALSDHKPEEAARQCQVVFEFGKTLGENDPKVKECSRSTTTPSKIAQ